MPRANWIPSSADVAKDLHARVTAALRGRRYAFRPQPIDRFATRFCSLQNLMPGDQACFLPVNENLSIRIHYAAFAKPRTKRETRCVLDAFRGFRVTDTAKRLGKSNTPFAAWHALHYPISIVTSRATGAPRPGSHGRRVDRPTTDPQGASPASSVRRTLYLSSVSSVASVVRVRIQPRALTRVRAVRSEHGAHRRAARAASCTQTEIDRLENIE